MTQRLLIVCLFVSSLIVCSKCCISLSRGGCAVGRISFGGRLLLAGKDEPGLGDINQPFIFVTPFAFDSYRKSPLGYGRGKIWIGKRNCLGYGSQSQIHCPIEESRPSLDTTTPCFSAPPAYTESEPLAFSDITEDSVRVSWPAWNETTDLGVGPVTQYKLQYREEGGVFNDILLDAYTLQYQFDSLKVGKTYEFQIILIRDLPYIESQPSSAQKATTLYGAPPSFNRSHPLEFSSVTYDSITVTWPAWNAETDSGVGPVIQHKIQYRESGGTFKDELLGPSVLSHRFDGLTGETEYEFRIILIREHPPMEGQPSITQTETTLPPEPPAYVQVNPLLFPIVTDVSITVTWPAWNEATGTGTGPVTEYRIQYREQGGEFQEIVITDSTVLSSKLDGLKEGTRYEFRIILVSATLKGTPSSVQTQSTPCGDLNDSELVLATESKKVGKSNIIATWSIRNLPDSCNVSRQSITIHQLDQDGCAVPSPGVNKTISMVPHWRKRKFSNLKANWDFNITLQVTNPAGVYTFSKLQRTEETRPGAAPANVALIEKEKCLKGFRWDEPPCYLCHGEIVRYRYFIQKDNEKPSYYTTENTFVCYRNSTPGTQFTFKVQACTTKGGGPYSVPVTLTF